MRSSTTDPFFSFASASSSGYTLVTFRFSSPWLASQLYTYTRVAEDPASRTVAYLSFDGEGEGGRRVRADDIVA